jgi:hypothetical protein
MIPENDQAVTQQEGDRVVPLATKYLDLDGDGVPDAVQITETVTHDVSGDGTPDVVEIIDELETGIGIDGVPTHVEVHEAAAVDVDHEEPHA